ncbi:MAG: Uma2 family endonuclease [Alkalinema sp. RU_4_3]|nr:Uma2 family endonuclease [Alkalinema sp. RU_4_3]
MTVAIDRPSQIKTDQVVTIEGDWAKFKLIQQGCAQSRGVRLFYFNGTIEILMPAFRHELFKSVVGFLIETFLFHYEIEFTPTGSATQEVEGVVAAEADESYEIQGYRLAIEIDFTNGSVSKLERYRALGTNEVWIWEDGVLDIYWLKTDGYQKADRSQIPALAAIDRAFMAQCILMGETSRIQAGKRLLGAELGD